MANSYNNNNRMEIDEAKTKTVGKRDLLIFSFCPFHLYDFAWPCHILLWYEDGTFFGRSKSAAS